MEDRQAAAELRREVEQVELGAQPAVVPPLGLLEPAEVLGERGGGLPGGAVDPLQLGQALVTVPVRAGDPGELEMPQAASRGHVRAAAQVDEPLRVAVGRHAGRVNGGLTGELGVGRLVCRGDALDDLALERLVGEEREPLGDRVFLADEGLIGGDDRPHHLLDRGQVLVREAPVPGELEVVVEAVGDRRPDREAGARVELEDGLGHHVRGRVADHRAAVVRSPGDDPHDVAGVKPRGEVDEDAVHLGGDGVGRQAPSDRGGEITGRGTGSELHRGAVGHGDGDHRRRLSHTLALGSAECNASSAPQVIPTA